MRMNKTEKAAAMAVLAMTAAVVTSGIKLLKKHTRYLAEKAAATFTDDGDEPDVDVKAEPEQKDEAVTTSEAAQDGGEE